MTRKKLPDPNMLGKYLKFDPDSGKMWWKQRSADDYASAKFPQRQASTFNASFAGRVAFTSISPDGYSSGKLLGVSVSAHRVLWALVHGAWPDHIDHINGDKTDNSISNLRNVTKRENAQNRPKRGDSSWHWSGVERLSSGRWRSSARLNGKRLVTGTFGCETAAMIQKKKCDMLLGHHANHGRLSHA